MSSSPHAGRLARARLATLLLDSDTPKAPPVAAVAKNTSSSPGTCRIPHAFGMSRTLRAQHPSSAPSNRKTSVSRRPVQAHNSGTSRHPPLCRATAAKHAFEPNSTLNTRRCVCMDYAAARAKLLTCSSDGNEAITSPTQQHHSPK